MLIVLLCISGAWSAIVKPFFARNMLVRTRVNAYIVMNKSLIKNIALHINMVINNIALFIMQ